MIAGLSIVQQSLKIDCVFADSRVTVIKICQLFGMRQPISGQYLLTISNKEFIVNKVIDHTNTIRNQKIFIFNSKRQSHIAMAFKLQLDRIRDHLQRVHRYPSLLQVSEHLLLEQTQQLQLIIFKVYSKYCQYPNLENYFKKQMINPYKRTPQTQKLLTHYFEECFELILKAGGIDYYFYTPRNIFIIPPQSEKDYQLGKLQLNYTSLCGLKLTFLMSEISMSRQNFCEIYPLLPPDYFERQEESEENGKCISKYLKDLYLLDRVIKKRALAFLILCFVLRRVPNFVDVTKVEILMQQASMKKLLQQSSRMFKALLRLSEKEVKQAEKMTGVNLSKLFDIVLVNNCQLIRGNQHKQITWSEIYSMLFLQNKANISQFNQLQDSTPNPTILNNNYFKRMVKSIYHIELRHDFYKKRGLVDVNEQEEDEPGMVYILVKIGSAFHKLLKYVNICEFVIGQQFNSVSHRVVTDLLALLIDQLNQVASHERKALSQSFQIINQTIAQKPQQSQSLAQFDNQQLQLGQRSSDLHSDIINSPGDFLVNEKYNELDQTKAEIKMSNPFYIKNCMEMELISRDNRLVNQPSQVIISELNGPIPFLRTALSRQNYDIQAPNYTIQCVNHRLSALLDFEESLWGVPKYQ